MLDPEVRLARRIPGRGASGYAKLTPLRALASAPLPGALELQQICVLSDWHGLRVADRLMSWALATAASDPAPEVYLTVFDHNERAKPRWLVG